MSRLVLALMLISALVATTFAWPVTTKQAGEESLSVLPLQKSGQQQEQQQVAQESAELKHEVSQTDEQPQVKSASSEQSVDEAHVHVEDKKEESVHQKQEEVKEDVKSLPSAEHKEEASQPEKEILQKAAIPAESTDSILPPATETEKEVAQPAVVQETVAEKKAEAKSSDPVNTSEEKPHITEEHKVKQLVEETKPAEPEHLPEVIAPVAETKQAVPEPAPITEEHHSETILEQPAKIDDKTDRVTREAEEAAKKQQQQQQSEEKKEAPLSKVPKSQEVETAQQPTEQLHTEQEKPKEIVQEETKHPVEASVAEEDEIKPLPVEPAVVTDSETQQSSSLESSQSLLKSHNIQEQNSEPAAESAAPIEKNAQEGPQHITEEVKAELKEAKSADQEPTKVEELPKPQEIKDEMTPVMMSEEMKKPEEKSSTDSSEENSSEEKSSEEKPEKTENSSEETKEKEVSSSRSDSGSSSEKLPSSS